MSKKNQTGGSGKQGKDSLKATRIIKMRLPTEPDKPYRNPFVSDTGQLLTGIPESDTQNPNSPNADLQGGNAPTGDEPTKPSNSKR